MKNLTVFIFLFSAVFGYTQQTEYVDFINAKAEINFGNKNSKVFGIVKYNFSIKKNIDSIYLNVSQINQIEPILLRQNLSDKKLMNEELSFKIIDGSLIVYHDFQKQENYVVSVSFMSEPKKALYFVKRNMKSQIWTQGQGKYTSNWLPSFDDVNEKIEFDLSITYDKDITVLANGKLENTLVSEGYKTWHYNMNKPMSSYLVALAIGKYDVLKQTSKSGVPIELYYYPEDSNKVEPTYRYTKQMFDFLEDEIGFAYPWQNYKQVPVHDFLYAGMENTSLTIFSDAFVVDSIGFNDKNYVNVNAHELAHQWFGDLVTATSGEHHWLQEGFATYYALLAEREVFGQDYFDFSLYNTAQQLAQQDLAGKGTSLLNPKSSSLTFYQRGAWVLYALRHLVGDMTYKTAVVNYLEKHQYANVKTSDFISEVEKLYGRSLEDFVNKWIVAIEFPFNDAIALLKENSVFIQEYVMVDCETNSSKCEDYLRYYVSDQAKIKVINQRPDLINADTFQESLKVRRAISQNLSKISGELKPMYETLLDDASYVTIENALYHLWVNFPTERSKYLFKTKDIDGLADKNVRLLWLVLHLNTPEYQSDKKKEILNELRSYTDSENGFELRMNAFQYLELIKACDADCKANLEQAKGHHNWRMSKFAKDMLNRLNTTE